MIDIAQCSLLDYFYSDIIVSKIFQLLVLVDPPGIPIQKEGEQRTKYRETRVSY